MVFTEYYACTILRMAGREFNLADRWLHVAQEGKLQIREGAQPN